MSDHQVTYTTKTDLPTIYELFEQSIQYQEKNNVPVWKHYDKGAIVRDIENGNQYKIIVDGITAIVFSVAYTDKIIWRERDRNDAIYLHRIVVNPAFKGRKLFGLILDWSINHVKEKGLKFVRMDTWGDNQRIIDYYMKFGFSFVENFTTPDTEELPVHNRNLKLALLEYRAPAN
jgi:ribosomal protein S18 acetylase RimI-like enzyme